MSPEAGKRRVHVQLFHGADAERYRREYLAGRQPDESPYGFHAARDHGFDVTFSRDAPRSERALPVRLSRKLLGLDVGHAFANRDRIARAEVIWTMTEREAFAIALLMALRIVPRRPIVASSVWLMSEWDRTPRYRQRLYRTLSRYLCVLTVQSRPCLPIAGRALPGVPSAFMPFGINLAMFDSAAPPAPPAPDAPIVVVAAGNDRTRDWPTLIAALGGDPRFRLTIVCPWLSAAAAGGHDNVTIRNGATMPEFLALYRDADIVAVPMVENAFSGITVALEAAAQRKAMLVSRTGGVPSYFAEDEALYVPVGDAVALREALLRTDAQSRAAMAARAHDRLIAEDYSTAALVRRYVDLTRRYAFV